MICEYCQKECKSKMSLGQHRVRCPKNANRVYKNGMTGKKAWNIGLTKETDPRLQKASETLSERYSTGDLTPSGAFSSNYHGTEAHRLSSARGGGYRENAGRSKKFSVIDSYGKKTGLQSTYEKRFAELLDKCGINWKRPPHMLYGEKRYFADFFLPDLNIYVDPKNDYKAKLDAEKIKMVIEENNVDLRILLNVDLIKFEEDNTAMAEWLGTVLIRRE